MNLDRDTPALDVENTRVFDYHEEVIVELHGHTPEGEFEVVSYAFSVRSDDERGLRGPEIDPDHEEIVREALSGTDYHPERN